MARKKKSPFVENTDDHVLWLDVKASGMHPLIPYIDGLPIATFSKDRRVFLRAEDVAAWHEKEVKESHGQSGDLRVASALRDILRQHREELERGGPSQGEGR